MAEEIEESGFYREDFSTESDWEVFNAQLGEVFQKWELSSCDWEAELKADQLFSCSWRVESETLEFLKNSFTVSYYSAQANAKEGTDTTEEVEPGQHPMHRDLMSVLNSFGPPLNARERGNDLHALARLFGLRRFVLIHPSDLQIAFLTNPSEFSFFLSAANVVAAEINAAVPIFVQIYDPKWNFFVGVGMAPSMRTNFTVTALDHSPAEYHYLAGLLALFKEKLPSSYVRPVTMSVRNTYALDTLRVRIPMSVPFRKDPLGDVETEGTKVVSVSQFTALPHGYFPDSCTEMFVVYTWPEIAENICMDSSLRSDFVPSKAPCGSIHQAVHATSYLSSCVRDYQKLTGSNQTIVSFVGRNVLGGAGGTEVPNPFDQITQPHLTAMRTPREGRSYVTPPPTAKKLPGPMNENELNQMIYYLFPDVHPEVALFPYPRKASEAEFDPHRIKSAVPDSLVCRLSCLLATCNGHFGGKSGLAQLWAAFVRELRYLWDNGFVIPGVASGDPDTRTCLLHQKLQMLNVCIERRKLRENEAQPARAELRGDDEDDDDEFYDCANYDEQTESPLAVNKPEGRQSRLNDMKLLDSEEPLYVPVTQELVPKTEDQLQDDAEVMLKLGPGSGLTTQMMCSSLLSDMEAFKAANPKCQIEDFIRWYSPKDWEASTDEDGHTAGKLSPRMLAPDNTWQTMWKQAQPVPAWRQKRLFDETNEAVKVLQYFETRSIGEIYEMTMVPMLHSAILKLKDIINNSQILELFSEQIDFLLADLCRLSRDIEIIGQTETGVISRVPSPEPIISKIEQLETNFYQYKCFERFSGYPVCTKLEDVKQQFKEILKNKGSCNIARSKGSEAAGDTAIVGALQNLSFKNEMREHLISKDYVLRIDGETANRNKGHSGPQFLRAIVTGDKLRLCGAFTENTTFI